MTFRCSASALLDRARELGAQARGVRRRQELEEGAPLAQVRGERAREQRVVRADLRAEETLELPVLADEGVEALGKGAALRVEVLRQRRRDALVHLGHARREELAHLGDERGPRLADARCVDLARRRAQREHADAQRRERERLAVVALVAPAKLGQDLGVGDLELQGEPSGATAAAASADSGGPTRPSGHATCSIALPPARMFSTSGPAARQLQRVFRRRAATPLERSTVRDTARASRSPSPTRSTDRRARVIAV